MGIMKPAAVAAHHQPPSEQADLRTALAAIWPDVTDLLPPGIVAAISAGAAAADAQERPNRESLDRLRAIGWPGLPVPEKLQGSGASLAQCCALQRALGGADPA